MKDIDLLLPRVHEKAPQCPEPTILRHLRDAAIEFCRRTRIWRCDDTFTIPAGGCETVAVEPGTLIYEITHASFSSDTCDERDLIPVTVDWLDKEEPGWRDWEAGPPVYITQSNPNSVRIAPAPDGDEEALGSLTVQLVLLPSTDADQLPDVLIDSYSREIADGALGSVLLLPAEFGNAQLGALHKGLFNEALGRFGDRAQRGQQRTPRRVRPSVNF